MNFDHLHAKEKSFLSITSLYPIEFDRLLTIFRQRCQLLAQNNATYPVRLLSDARDGAIRLRWAPEDFATWNTANQNGYRLERYEEDAPETRTLIADNIRPLPLAEWEPISDSLEMALLYAGALYSEEFSLPTINGGQSGGEDAESMKANRHSMALFAADLFFEVALAGGLAYEDRDVERETIYIYELKIIDFNATANYAFTLSRVNADRRKELPRPATPQANWDTDEAQLNFEQQLTQANYTAYFIERSVAGAAWERRNEYPLVYFETDGTLDDKLYFTDSLENNTSEHRYRFYGRSPFGIDGPPSEAVAGFGIPPPIPYRASISNLIQTSENGVRIEWTVPPLAEGLIDGIRIYRAPDPLGRTLLLTPQKLRPERRSFVDTEPRPGEYYTIVLLDKNGYELASRPRLIVLEDNSPPAPPVAISGLMDSLGKVKLTWAANTEPDHQGYRVYISNQAEGHFVQVTENAILETSYEYEVTMNTASETVYFKLKAIDYYGNYSELSEVVVVERPDLQPPGAANIREIEGRKEGVFISWSLSPSEDVLLYELQRKPATPTEEEWESVFESRVLQGEILEQEFLDVNTQAGRSYQYQLLVTDDANLSTASRPSTATRIDDGSRGDISNFLAVQQENGSVVLAFTCTYPVDPTFFQIYRAKNGESLTTYLQLTPDDSRLQTVGPQQYQLRDLDVKEGDVVSYRILARYGDGGFSNLAEVRLE